MIGPFMSYKGIFKRKNKIYRIGDIRIPWGISLEQFITISLALTVELVMYLALPFMKNLGLATWIIIMVGTVVGGYKAIDKVDFRGMGLFYGMKSVFSWLVSHKRTLMDKPVYKGKKAYEANVVTSGLASDNLVEILYVKEVNRVVLSGSMTVLIKGEVMTITKKNRPFRNSNVRDGGHLVLDKMKPLRLKLKDGRHTLVKMKDSKSGKIHWVYGKEGKNANDQISDETLDGSHYF